MPGPVTSWGDTYSTATGTDSMFIPGQLTLSVCSIPTEEYFVGAIKCWTCSPTADLDGDGDLDMLHPTFEEGQFSWSENTDGAGTSWTYHPIMNYYFPGVIHPYDMDGDGDIDAVGATGSGTLPDLSWFENLDGSGTSWDEHLIEDYYFPAEALDIGDLDGDGDPDVLGCSKQLSCINWSENTDGTGTPWVTHELWPDYYDVSDVHAVDMDNDGDLDVLAASYYGGCATWLENDGTG